VNYPFKTKTMICQCKLLSVKQSKHIFQSGTSLSLVCETGEVCQSKHVLPQVLVNIYCKHNHLNDWKKVKTFDLHKNSRIMLGNAY